MRGGRGTLDFVFGSRSHGYQLQGKTYKVVMFSCNKNLYGQVIDDVVAHEDPPPSYPPAPPIQQVAPVTWSQMAGHLHISRLYSKEVKGRGANGLSHKALLFTRLGPPFLRKF